MHFRNGSDFPIHDVTYKVRLESSDSAIDGHEYAPTRSGNHLDIVPPRETPIVTLSREDFLSPIPEDFDFNAPMPTVNARVAIQFKDSSGNYWRRHADGDLEKDTGELRF